ncbi:hypothetical protein GGU10DRAFT_382244 [Lentinula aff. detonsa]|uniref:Uncharacterized protein n=1 Tax=Lentinula aff. detonsa TaxID=2804958 RepID=A0AA38KB40_9AGAR|nr:hypothetical protein GGU10DRAFT_382244 [Lentinula aff. detonsa]
MSTNLLSFQPSSSSLSAASIRSLAKSKRSTTSWRSESKAVFPSIGNPRPVFVNVSPNYTGNSEKPQLISEFGSFRSTDKSGTVALGRNNSTTSSFGTPEPVRASVQSASHYDDDERSTVAEEEDEEAIRHHSPPVFKSSCTAL